MRHLGCALSAVFWLGCAGNSGSSTSKPDPSTTETTTGSGSSSTTETDADPPATPVQLDPVRCDSEAAALPDGWADALTSAGLTKCASPFGIIIGAAEDVPDAYIRTVAQIVAELLDPDIDGVANDSAVLEALANGRNVWLPMPTNRRSWTGGVEEELGRTLRSYGIMIPQWWLGPFRDDGPDEHARAVMVEEVIHAFTQFGYGRVYPDAFGVNSWQSVIAKETAAAQCDWWQHPENDCPGRPSEGGDCSDPSCDVTEFYQQVVVMRAGMTPGWLGIGFPENRESLEERLSDDIKAVMDNPDHHQLRAPLTFRYGD